MNPFRVISIFLLCTASFVVTFTLLIFLYSTSSTEKINLLSSSLKDSQNPESKSERSVHSKDFAFALNALSKAEAMDNATYPDLPENFSSLQTMILEGGEKMNAASTIRNELGVAFSKILRPCWRQGLPSKTTLQIYTRVSIDKHNPVVNVSEIGVESQVDGDPMPENVKTCIVQRMRKYRGMSLQINKWDKNIITPFSSIERFRISAPNLYCNKN